MNSFHEFVNTWNTSLHCPYAAQPTASKRVFKFHIAEAMQSEQARKDFGRSF
jgi:hypothetical protein